MVVRCRGLICWCWWCGKMADWECDNVWRGSNGDAEGEAYMSCSETKGTLGVRLRVDQRSSTLNLRACSHFATRVISRPDGSYASIFSEPSPSKNRYVWFSQMTNRSCRSRRHIGTGPKKSVLHAQWTTMECSSDDEWFNVFQSFCPNLVGQTKKGIPGNCRKSSSTISCSF